MHQTSRFWPKWIRGNFKVNHLPAIYRGVLGQVQSQSNIRTNSSPKSSSSSYMDRLTDTDRVHQLLPTSRLSNDALASIWAHVNRTHPGILTNREVCLALALIAIHQRLDGATECDPFSLIKSEKEPPLPKLYSSTVLEPSAKVQDHNAPTLSMIEIEFGDSFAFKLNSIIQVWFRIMTAMKHLFKGVFDTLNVKYDRNPVREALSCPRGISFIEQLGLCYPLAHNINRGVISLGKEHKTRHEFGDLMNSINEYWAVLINLFHEAGQTNIVECIMDGLCSANDITLDVLRLQNEDSRICRICYTSIYLEDSSESKPMTMSVRDHNELLTLDSHHYYHTKCANFWLNHVNPKELPLHDMILE